MRRPFSRTWLLGLALAFLLAGYVPTTALPRESTDKVTFLIEKLKDSSFKVRLKAALLLGRLADRRAVEPLMNALSDGNYVVRGAAARALGNLGYPAALPALNRLLRLANDDEVFVRKEAVKAIRKLAGPEAIDTLIAALSDGSPQVRLVAVHILGKLDLPGVRRAVVEAMGDEDELVRQEAIESLKGLGRAELNGLLRQALQNGGYRVQEAAVRLAEQLRMVELLDVIADMLVRDDVVPAVKREAGLAIAQMKDALNLDKIIQDSASSEPALRDKAVRLLGIYGGAKAVDRLLSMLKTDDTFLKRRVVAALGEAGDPRAIPALEYLRSQEQDKRLLQQIEISLRRLKPR
ncbi:MAG: HEAT repeat domain-containing protein [Deltaproteobacteria bacterium]|nr:MAG: HEAT repeat domain-containing protein [Deltaproteobacteria bacterium]